MNIKYLDSVECKADKEAIKVIKRALEYDSAFWKQDPFQKKKVPRKAYFVDGRSGLFLTGLLGRIKQVYKGPIDYSDREILKPECKPSLKDLTFRDDQIELINIAIKEQRGIIKAPTGTGKTVIAMGIMSCFPSANILFVCHNMSILKQTVEEIHEKGMKCNFVNDTEKFKKGINLISIQTLANLNPNDYDIFFDIVLVDEAHRTSAKNGQYETVLRRMLCPMKIGFTATPPIGKEKILRTEGIIGNVIGELTLEEGTEKGIFVKPNIVLIPVPWQKKLNDLKNYNEIYYNCIVNSKVRNNLILREANSRVKDGKSVVIMVKDLEHGDNLLDMIEEKYDLLLSQAIFVEGKTDLEIREKVKKALQGKKIKCVIVTAVWREGINIPSLNCVILALGGKSAIQIMQTIGRGTRADEGKDSVDIIDFIDRYKYLAQHFTERLCLYVRNNWM